MAATRSIGLDVLSGLRIAVIGACGALVILSLLDGERRLFAPGRTSSTDYYFAVGELLFSGAALLKTAAYWAKWILPMMLFISIKGTFWLIRGTTATPPYRAVSLLTEGTTLVFALLSAWFSYHLSRAPLERGQRIGVSGFMFCLAGAILFEPSYLAMALGTLSLIVTSLRTHRHVKRPKV